MWSKSEKQEWEKIVQNFQCTKTATHPPPPPKPDPPLMVSDCISKGCCPKEIEKNYPLRASGKTVLITLCTFKHIPEREEEKKRKKKDVFWRELKREKKMKAGRLNYKRRLRNTKHYFTKF